MVEVKKKVRNSNYELMRIVSMFLIVLYHVIHHGGTINLSVNPICKEILHLLELVTIVHVNSFILVTGYFQSEGKFRLSKLFELMALSFFYKFVIIIIFSYFDIIDLSKTQILNELSPIEIVQNWYFKYYMFLYMLSPFINIGLNNLSKKNYLKLIGVLFVIFSIIPICTGGIGMENTGFTLYHFIYLYIVGAYLKKYPVDKEELIKKLSKLKCRLILIGIMIVCILFNYVLYKCSYKFMGVNSLIDSFCWHYRNYNMLYSNPLIVIQSLAYFILFGTFSFSNKIVNHISKITFGIYLLHDNSHVRLNIYKWMNIDGELIYSLRYFIYVFIIALIVFVGSFIIDSFRSWICYYIKKNKYVVRFENWLDKFKICDVE
ncbi:MAG: acyltransferase [Bacilli bacterium]|nr:acyltransferase [Bacilli bacterium]